MERLNAAVLFAQDSAGFGADDFFMPEKDCCE